MEGSVDWKPVQFSTFILIVYVSLNTGKVAELALFDVNQKLHIVPYNMILLFMFLETVLLSI